MVNIVKVNKQNLMDDLMVENIKLARKIAVLEAAVASLRNAQQTQPAICAECGGAIHGTGTVENCGYPLCECSKPRKQQASA